MSKSRNVNPDHYKTRGSLRQGEEIVSTEEKERFGREKAKPPRRSRRAQKARRKS